MEETRVSSSRGESARNACVAFLTTAPSPWRPVQLYGPFLIGWLGLGWLAEISVRVQGLALLAGLIEWSLVEYLNHRFFFHWHPRSRRLRQALDTFHALHHREPYRLTVVVANPSISIPFAIVNLLLLGAVLDSWIMAGLVNVGFGLGYLAYEYTHYAVHKALVRGEPWPRWAGYHLAHHFVDARTRFGVTNTLWDHVFFTFAPPVRRMPSQR